MGTGKNINKIRKMKLEMLNRRKKVEMPGIEPGAFHMQSERSTTEPHPQLANNICAPKLKENTCVERASGGKDQESIQPPNPGYYMGK